MEKSSVYRFLDCFCGGAIYILRRQDDYAPRYFLAMLVPLILILVLTLQELEDPQPQSGLASWRPRLPSPWCSIRRRSSGS